MVVAGCPVSTKGNLHAPEVANMALKMLSAIRNLKIFHRPQDQLKLRIGIHTGKLQILTETYLSNIMTKQVRYARELSV